jgi:hypothetical protein
MATEYLQQLIFFVVAITTPCLRKPLLKYFIPSSQPSPQRGEWGSSSPPVEERIEVSRDLNLFHVTQSSLV